MYKNKSYEVGGNLWIPNIFLTDNYSESHLKEKLTENRNGPIKITKRVGKKAHKVDLPGNLRSIQFLM